MYLKNIVLRNFRSFDEGQVELQSDLTVFVGENNGGKSNAIDAIRLLTQPLSDRRDIYCETTDARFGSERKGFEIEGLFTGLNAGQQGRLITAATDTTLTKARFGLHYAGNIGDRPVHWAGKPGNTAEAGCHEMVRHVYLPPLRDAKRALASGNPTRIMALLNHFLKDGDADELAKRLARPSSHAVLKDVDRAVGKGLSELTSGVRLQAASLGFSAQEDLIEIARDLRFKLADHGVTPEDLRYSGHGYANLLYMATIAVELENVRKSDLTLFLVEEPEAHLHPQLQAAVLAFLSDQASNSKSGKPKHGPAGEIQVIVASHSPNLSAWVSSKQLVVFKSVNSATPPLPEEARDDVEANTAETPAEADTAAIESGFGSAVGEEEGSVESFVAVMAAAAMRRSTRCVALADVALSDSERRKIDRYLDVTKAALLFGGRVLLVEGIAEALLLPVIAEHHTLKGDPEKLRLFRSAVFVPIDGVDFIPYANLLTTKLNGARIADRVVVMTDGDRGKGKKAANKNSSSQGKAQDSEAPEALTEEMEAEAGVMEGHAPTESPTGENVGEGDQALEPSANGDDDGTDLDDASALTGEAGQKKATKLTPGEGRKAALDKLAQTNDALDCLSTVISTYTLETELLEVGNAKILRQAFLSLHKNSAAKWDEAVALAGDARADAIDKIFKGARKGDFAQTLAGLIEKPDPARPFTVPAYIEDAIKAVVA